MKFFNISTIIVLLCFLVSTIINIIEQDYETLIWIIVGMTWMLNCRYNDVQHNKYKDSVHKAYEEYKKAADNLTEFYQNLYSKYEQKYYNLLAYLDNLKLNNHEKVYKEKEGIPKGTKIEK